MHIRVKGVFTILLLEKLVKVVEPFQNDQIYKTVFLVAFLAFFRLASLLPNSIKEFDRTRYLTLGDVIWGQPGVHLVMTCTKIGRPQANTKYPVAFVEAFRFMSSSGDKILDKDT